MKRSYKKRQCKKHMSLRKKNKGYQLGGTKLSDIDMYISIMDDTDKTFTELQKYADIMTIQQTYAIINHLIGGNADLKSTDEFKPLLQKIEKRLTKFPKLVENIKILIDGLSTEYGINIDSLNFMYATFPISKINPNLGTIITNGKRDITYEQNRYTFLGKGGFGSVFVNSDPDINQAIKMVKPLHEEIQELFKNEAINYNNISSIVCNTNYFCKFKSSFVSKNIIYILMEYCGQNLLTTIKERAVSEKLSFETLIKWFITIAKGIKCMHDNDYVHLDIKPINITINDNDDEAKLIDFGLAQDIHEIVEPYEKGTYEYMAPEMGGFDIDYKKCDIYALGITFAKCIFEYYISLFKKKSSNAAYTFDDSDMMLSFIGLESMLAEDPSDRPTINYVISILVSFPIQNTFLQNLKAAEFSVAELKNADFSLKDIFKAGYTYGEIRDIYKASKGSADLKKLLKHCDKTWDFPKRHKSQNCTIDTICSTNSQLSDCKDRGSKMENGQINLIKTKWSRRNKKSQYF